MTDKVFKYIMEGGDADALKAASMEYLEGMLGVVLQDLCGLRAAVETAIVDLEHGDSAAAFRLLKEAMR